MEFYLSVNRLNVLELLKTLKEFFANNPIKAIINIQITNAGPFGLLNDDIHTDFKIYQYQNDGGCERIGVKIADNVSLNMKSRLY